MAVDKETNYRADVYMFAVKLENDNLGVPFAFFANVLANQRR